MPSNLDCHFTDTCPPELHPAARFGIVAGVMFGLFFLLIICSVIYRRRSGRHYEAVAANYLPTEYMPPTNLPHAPATNNAYHSPQDSRPLGPEMNYELHHQPPYQPPPSYSFDQSAAPVENTYGDFDNSPSAVADTTPSHPPPAITVSPHPKEKPYQTLQRK